MNENMKMLHYETFIPELAHLRGAHRSEKKEGYFIECQHKGPV